MPPGREWRLHLALGALGLTVFAFFIIVRYQLTSLLLPLFFFGLPFAMPYAILSTALFVALGRKRSGVFLAHCISFAVGVLGYVLVFVFKLGFK